VNESVDAVGRILLTLTQARDRRTELVTALTGDPSLPLDRLHGVLGVTASGDFERARGALRQAAEGAAREAAINRGVLRRALEAGEAFLQELFSSTAGPAPVYGPREARAESGSGPAVLVNRRI
jgi:hypothetical protein